MPELGRGVSSRPPEGSGDSSKSRSGGLHFSPADEAALLGLDDIVAASRNEDVLEERRRSLRSSAGLLSQNLEHATRPSSPSIADVGVRPPDFH